MKSTTTTRRVPRRAAGERVGGPARAAKLSPARRAEIAGLGGKAAAAKRRRRKQSASK